MSFMVVESSRTCSLHVLLSRTDHSVIGGYVVGMLMVATPVEWKQLFNPMDSQKSSIGVKTTKILSNHGELFGVVGKSQLIHVNIGEIMTLLQQGRMKICILYAVCGIYSVALQESAMGGDIVTHE
ncbi:hypothetical protein H5410_022094, partial [Solanum commersonii]